MKTWEECPPPRGTADAAGVAAEKPPPREDVVAANEGGAAPDENMGGMPPPRGAADAAGVAAGKPPPREDVVAANEVGAASDAARLIVFAAAQPSRYSWIPVSLMPICLAVSCRALMFA